ncbi:uncharacterized protein C2orf16-like [Mya arenaria]|uniref:uncharacterized protein C2orf16-like n=1 Tax=Mya arenaria TaxID=6604 RepID=UPI0022E0139E|nr:uncharacterized protein C2orf16-like [Mya arenaria]
MSLGKVPYAGLDEQTYKQTVLDGSRPPMGAYMHMYMYRVLKSCCQYYPDDRPNAEQVLNQLLDVQGRVSESEETAIEKERRHGQPLNSRQPVIQSCDAVRQKRPQGSDDVRHYSPASKSTIDAHQKQLPKSKEDVSVILNPKFGARFANKHSNKAEVCDQDTFSTKHTGFPNANPGATGRPSARPKASYQELQQKDQRKSPAQQNPTTHHHPTTQTQHRPTSKTQHRPNTQTQHHPTTEHPPSTETQHHQTTQRQPTTQTQHYPTAKHQPHAQWGLMHNDQQRKHEPLERPGQLSAHNKQKNDKLQDKYTNHFSNPSDTGVFPANYLMNNPERNHDCTSSTTPQQALRPAENGVKLADSEILETEI